MTIDDAIKNHIVQSERALHDIEYYTTQNDMEWLDDCKKEYEQFAEEHRQLAEWLKALKEIWDSGDCNNCRNGQCEWKPKLGQLVRFNCPHYVGVANEEVNADEDSD